MLCAMLLNWVIIKFLIMLNEKKTFPRGHRAIKIHEIRFVNSYCGLIYYGDNIF